MDNEKKYNELVGKIKKAYLYAQTNSTKAVLEDILPELKESKDERIRRVLIDYFNRYKEQEKCGVKTFYGIPTDDILAWLKKQESVRKIVERCKNSWYNEGKIQGQIEGLSDEEKYQQGWHDALEKQGEQILANSAKTGKIEQTPSWSEEDKNFMYDTLSNLTELKDRYGEGYGNVGKCIGWLKSLKERCTWKPSDEQMKALRDLNLTGNISYAGQGQTLIELYNDLKKLKG